MARPSNAFDSITLTIAVTPQIKAYLDDLVEGGLLGSSAAEVARALIGRGVVEQHREGLPKREFQVDEANNQVLKRDKQGQWVPIKNK